jgi:hypothetical protein
LRLSQNIQNLEDIAMPKTEVTPLATEIHDCPLCGTPLDPVHPNECTRCDWVVGYRRRQNQTQNPARVRDTAALVLSVVPGLGHIYKGRKFLGMLLMAGTLVVGFFVTATVSATAGVALLLIPIYWSAVMLHAYWLEEVPGARFLSPRISGHS